MFVQVFFSLSTQLDMEFLPISSSVSVFIPGLGDYLSRVPFSLSSCFRIIPSLFTQSLPLSSPDISLTSKIRLYYLTLLLVLNFITDQMAVIYQFPVEVSSEIISSGPHLKLSIIWHFFHLAHWTHCHSHWFWPRLALICSHMSRGSKLHSFTYLRGLAGTIQWQVRSGMEIHLWCTADRVSNTCLGSFSACVRSTQGDRTRALMAGGSFNLADGNIYDKTWRPAETAIKESSQDCWSSPEDQFP